MLAGYKYGMNADYFQVVIFHVILDGDLGLGIGSDPWKNFLFSYFGDSFAQSGGQKVAHGHTFFGLVTGVTDHHALVTGSDLFRVFLQVHSFGNIWGLFIDCYNDCFVSFVSQFF